MISGKSRIIQNTIPQLKILNMKKIILILLVLNSSFLFSQTKSETEKWIEEKYYEYQREVNSDDDLTFENGNLIYRYLGSDLPQIKIKEIKQVQIRLEKFNSKDEVGWTAIYIYYGKGNYYKIGIDSKFYNGDLPNRMYKALIHLVKLYGGNATIKKEAF